MNQVVKEASDHVWKYHVIPTGHIFVSKKCLMFWCQMGQVLISTFQFFLGTYSVTSVFLAWGLLISSVPRSPSMDAMEDRHTLCVYGHIPYVWVDAEPSRTGLLLFPFSLCPLRCFFFFWLDCATFISRQDVSLRHDNIDWNVMLDNVEVSILPNQ